MTPLELSLHRKNTKAFIDADPLALVLVPHAIEKDAGGGRKLVPGEPREEQAFRLIPMSDVMPTVQTIDGIQLTPTYVLLGEHDAQMARWDIFSINGVDYQIISPIRPEHTVASIYERKADVARR